MSSTPTASRPTDRRVTLKPVAGGDAGHVDGAWWPRSHDLVAEVHALVRDGGLGAHLERVSYRSADWDDAPRRMDSGSSFVRLSGYGRLPANTANLSVDGRWVVLLVIPPETTQGPAERALETAGAPGNVDSVADLLADPAPPVTTSAGPMA